MIQCAVWTWYDKLLNSYDRKFPWQPEATGEFRPVPSPLATIKTLLAHGADFYCNGSLVQTLLAGLVLNVVQFNGEERPLEVTRACISTWLGLVQELGFNLKDYLRAEAEKQNRRYYDIGTGIKMMVCFNEDTAPHIWTVFQGLQERERGVVVDRISQCAVWKEWQRLCSLPKPPNPPKLRRIWEKHISEEIILVKNQCCCPSFDAHSKRCKGSNMENQHDTELSQTTQTPLGTLPSSISSRPRIAPILLYYIISAKPYRHEFTFYIFVLACFFGCSYFARFWITAGFFLALKLFQDATSYWL
jgi:hypothetical protein